MKIKFWLLNLWWNITRPSSMYDRGWADGWNACRSARPEDRIFRSKRNDS